MWSREPTPPCASCKFDNGLVQMSMDKDQPYDVRAISAGMHNALQAEVRDCPGWSKLRYLDKILNPDPPVDIVERQIGERVRLIQAEEETCLNPYRATDDYWTKRGELEDAMIRGAGDDPSGFLTARTSLEIAAFLAVEQEITAAAIAKHQRN